MGGLLEEVALGQGQLFLKILLRFTVCKQCLETLCPWILRQDRWLHVRFTEMRKLRPREEKGPIRFS